MLRIHHGRFSSHWQTGLINEYDQRELSTDCGSVRYDVRKEYITDPTSSLPTTIGPATSPTLTLSPSPPMDSDMTTHTDIDTLIAALHPHVAISLFGHKLYAPESLQPSRSMAYFQDLAQAFATLFGFHPGCDTAAVAPQIAPSGKTSFSVCLSPSIPREFEDNLEKWLAQFSALGRDSESKCAENAQWGDVLSPLERRFILHTYQVCYPAIHRQTALRGFCDWDVFVQDTEDVASMETCMKPTEEEERLTEQYADDLDAFSELVRSFMDCVSRDSLGEDEEVLRFHKLCMTIRDKMSNNNYLNEYVCKRLALFAIRTGTLVAGAEISCSHRLWQHRAQTHLLPSTPRRVYYPHAVQKPEDLPWRP